VGDKEDRTGGKKDAQDVNGNVREKQTTRNRKTGKKAGVDDNGKKTPWKGGERGSGSQRQKEVVTKCVGLLDGTKKKKREGNMPNKRLS